MDIVKLLIGQIITMFLYMAVGFVLFRTKKIDKQGSGTLATLMVWLILPVVVVKSYCVEPTREKIADLGWSMLAAALALALSIAVSRLLFKKRPIDNFAAAFSNAGFIGIPLVQAALGADAVFFITSFVAFLNVLQWIYGVAVINESGMKVTRTTVTHPLVLGTVLGLILFFTGLGAKLPSVITGAMGGIAALNAPIAMMVLGVYLAQANMKTLWADLALYKVSAVRLLLIPALTVALFLLLGLGRDMSMALLIAASAPVGANVAVYAQLYQKDYVYASKTVVISTILSLATMPLVILLAQSVLK